MRNAETILNIIRERGSKGLPIEDVYRQLYNPDLFLRAYTRIQSNEGATTKGITEETVDDMSVAKIQGIIEALRFERYRWTPVRRVEIPKPNGKTRPLGIPTWSDKLLQEVMRSLLEAYYEPQFENQSHGFRPERGCHTALSEVSHTWKGTTWFIEGDIKGCFDNINHEILVGILRERIHDNRFLRLVDGLLKAGYMEWWQYKPTPSGTPQGGIISPLLSNIYLDKLDKFAQNILIPEYTVGERRRDNPKYMSLGHFQRKAHRCGDVKAAREIRKEKQQLPRLDTHDPNYRRLRYIRYADDFLLGFAGPKEEAEAIKAKLATFLRDELKLEMSAEKTLITHARSERAKFLGYEVYTQHGDDYRDYKNSRMANSVVGLRIPQQTIERYCKRYMKNGKAIHRAELLEESDYDIVQRYGAEYRGIVGYFMLANNVSYLNKLKWIMQSSLLKTLAHKHKSSVKTTMLKYGTTAATESGPRRCIQVTVEREGKKPLVARFGGISLKRKKNAILADRVVESIPMRSELIQRLMAGQCEVCGDTSDIRVHHIRKMADLKRKGGVEKPLWVQIMAARRRKTMILCHICHVDLHAGRPFQKLATK